MHILTYTNKFGCFSGWEIPSRYDKILSFVKFLVGRISKKKTINVRLVLKEYGS